MPRLLGDVPLSNYWHFDRSTASTYAINMSIVSNQGSALRGDLSRVTNPSSTMLIAETSSGFTWFSGEPLWSTWTCADMILRNASLHQVTPLATKRNIKDYDGGAYTTEARLPAVKARVTVVAADLSAKSRVIEDSRPRVLDNDKVVEPFWSGVSCSPLQP